MQKTVLSEAAEPSLHWPGNSGGRRGPAGSLRPVLAGLKSRLRSDVLLRSDLFIAFRLAAPSKVVLEMK